VYESLIRVIHTLYEYAKSWSSSPNREEDRSVTAGCNYIGLSTLLVGMLRSLVSTIFARVF